MALHYNDFLHLGIISVCVNIITWTTEGGPSKAREPKGVTVATNENFTQKNS